MRLRIVPILVTVAAAACASGGGGPAPVRRPTANLITAEEIAEQRFQARNAMQAVMILRPNWPRNIPVYLDFTLLGIFERMQEVPSDSVREIRLLAVQEARVRFGPEAQASIQIVRKR
jgi:hypothetical protein